MILAVSRRHINQCHVDLCQDENCGAGPHHIGCCLRMVLCGIRHSFGNDAHDHRDTNLQSEMVIRLMLLLLGRPSTHFSPRVLP